MTVDAEILVRKSRAPRTNLFLAAAAELDGFEVPVRIRNLSETGALIEGVDLPGPGARILLKRGDTRVPATIMWATGIRRGVDFGQSVALRRWSTSIQLPAGGQDRVDAIQEALRAGATIEPAAPIAPGPQGAEALEGKLDRRIAEELEYVQRLVADLGDQLVADWQVVHRHGASLQNIDLAGQILGQIAKILVAENRVAAVNEIGMEDLRGRLTRKVL